jgi:hypothetical protein
MRDKENPLTGTMQARSVAPATLPAKAAEPSSPAQQVLGQFRRFVPLQAARAEAGVVRKNVELNAQLLARREEGATDLVKEGLPRTSPTIAMGTTNYETYDWSKPSTSPVLVRRMGEFRGPVSAERRRFSTPGYYDLSAYSPSPARKELRFWKSLTWAEYLFYIVVVFSSIYLLYLSVVGTLKGFLGDYLQGNILNEKSSTEQSNSALKPYQPASGRQRKKPERRRRRAGAPPGYGQKASQSQAYEVPLPPAVSDYTDDSTGESTLAPVPVEYGPVPPSKTDVSEAKGVTSRGGKLWVTGTRIALELAENLRSDSSLTVAARVTSAVPDRNENVLIPAGTTVMISFLTAPTLRRLVNVPSAEIWVTLNDGRRLLLRGEVKDMRSLSGLEATVHRRRGQSFFAKFLRGSARIAAGFLTRNNDLRDASPVISDALKDNPTSGENVLEVRAGTPFFLQLR